VLPAAVLGVSSAGGSLRFLRNSLLDVMGQDYIRAARAKGLSERRVLAVHGLRNAAAPTIQVLAINLGALLNGALVVEVVFGWPGVGRVTVDAINSNDYPVVLAATTLAAVMVLASNFAADAAQAALDPRIRHR
jgi:peptide/nickel transport system permease protein